MYILFITLMIKSRTEILIKTILFFMTYLRNIYTFCFVLFCSCFHLEIVHHTDICNPRHRPHTVRYFHMGPMHIHLYFHRPV